MTTDCLDAARLSERLHELRELQLGLTSMLIPHMEAVEAAVYPTLERLLPDRHTTAPMALEHGEIRRLVGAIGEFAEHPQAHTDRGAVLALRRVLLRLYALLSAHLTEEELYIPILEDRPDASGGGGARESPRPRGRGAVVGGNGSCACSTSRHGDLNSSRADRAVGDRSNHRRVAGDYEGSHSSQSTSRCRENMIRIAAVSEDGVTISQHFGRAPIYVVVGAEEGRVVSRETRDKLGHAQFAAEGHETPPEPDPRGHGFDPVAQDRHATMVVAIADCQVLLARGMGAGAFASMQRAGIEPIVTDIEDIGSAVEAYVAGTHRNQVEKLN